MMSSITNNQSVIKNKKRKERKGNVSRLAVKEIKYTKTCSYKPSSSYKPSTHSSSIRPYYICSAVDKSLKKSFKLS